MVIRLFVLAALIGAVTAASAGAQAKVYKTPQEVFEAATAAAKKGDMKTFFSLLEEGSLNQVTAGMAMTGMFFRSFAELDKTGKAKDAMKDIEKVMKKHGLSAEATK